jgi:hypothetical protein
VAPDLPDRQPTLVFMILRGTAQPTLTTMAAEHELVLVCDHDVASSLIRAAHTLRPGHRLLAIVLTADEPTAVHLPAGLHTDTELIPTAETVPR